MKKLLITSTFLLTISAITFGQSRSERNEGRRSEERERRPLINEETKEEIREKTKEAGEEVKDAGRDIEESTKGLREDIRETTQDAKQEVRESIIEPTREHNAEYGLPWFDRGNVFIGGSIGAGLGANSGTYLTFNPRIGYFFQPGFMAGLRLGYDRRLSTSFRSSQVGVFARYYPFRTRISSFVGAGYNFGRERASNVDEDEKSRFNSINLEAGIMFYALPRLGIEGALETNYYDRSNPLAGRNRGGRIKLGVNYYFTRGNR